MDTQILTEYLASLKRLPYVSDKQIIQDTFDRNKLVLTDELLDFQFRYAGYFHSFPPHSFIYGLLHHQGEYLPALDLDFDDEDLQRVLITCMDCHPSNARAIDHKGVYYKDYSPVAESFTKYLIQRAFFWKESQAQIWKNLNLSSHVEQVVRQEQTKALEKYFVADASDQYSQVYYVEELMLKVEQEQVIAWKIEGTSPKLFYFSL